ncbi:hypothetical protein QMK19_06980 [Streptomyces sp. H10-C2]|uniref:rhomboid-like protein n=1 Tax=unclassified Streptomyces TaxID=2593676 RepID=UPI0024BB6D27|nr:MULTISPECIES: rhomboid-like protein [unclassified Streptomyces]MDJ0341225.1 hypothetical protein [Streptomyces sp. PH10-H1]MDJ0369422.1 hypothetical protein [Streptomyces sp. H10-C2]
MLTFHRSGTRSPGLKSGLPARLSPGRSPGLSAPWAAPAYVAAVQAGAYALLPVPEAEREELLRAHSTNVDNLRARHWHTLLTSAFLAEEPLDPGYGAVLLGVLGGAETVWGPRRTASVFAFGHLGASLLVYGGLRAAGASKTTQSAVDVGSSYGLNAVLGAAAVSLPHRAGRAVAAAGLLTMVVRPLLRERRTFTDAGHLAALLLGLGAGHSGAFTRG